MITRLAQIISSHVRFFLMKMTMHRYMNNNKHALHIQHYVMNCRYCCCKEWFSVCIKYKRYVWWTDDHLNQHLYSSIGDWFVLYQMSKNMNKRFFAEFIALLSLKINPDPYLSADPEIDILKRSDDEEGPNGDSGVGRIKHNWKSLWESNLEEIIVATMTQNLNLWPMGEKIFVHCIQSLPVPSKALSQVGVSSTKAGDLEQQRELPQYQLSNQG